jgi:POT family proton-dependent oligopeptide transporter
MADHYRTTPQDTTGMPSGIPYIVGNEAAERFSFYGMRGILVVFMTKYLMDGSGSLSPMSDAEATSYYHWFITAAYFFPLLGALVADTFWGKYRTIMNLSIVYCLGHLALALDETRLGLTVGLTLIALGTGGIKPCVSAHVGDQFGKSNEHLLERVFGWFYFSINFGSSISTLLTPLLLQWYGPHIAFGIPGALMFLATFVFWLGRHKYVHVPPAGKEFVRTAFSSEGLAAMRRLAVIYVFIAVFWSLYDQHGSSWVLQAEKMDRVVDLGSRSFEILPAHPQSLNPILVMIFIPLFSFVIYPLVSRVFPLTSLRKMGIGFVLTAASFAVAALISQSLQAGHKPHILWQTPAYVLLTAGEVMIYLTGLEFSYTQAPPAMKSFVMSLYLLTVSLGNMFTALVNTVIQRPDGTSRLEGANYFWFFCLLMLASTVVFVFVAMRYQGKTYLQGDEAPSAA